VNLTILNEAALLEDAPTSVVLTSAPDAEHWTLVVDGVPAIQTADPTVAVALYAAQRRLLRGRS
jgi:hypothetical protein